MLADSTPSTSRWWTPLWLAVAAMTLTLAMACDTKPREDASAASNAGASKGELAVGHFGSMTGSEATFGNSTDNGIRLAVEELNARGGVKLADGSMRQVRLITYDTRGQASETGAVVTRLITSDEVVAVLGEVASSLSLAAGPVAQQAGVPMISPSSTNPKVTEIGDMVHRICFIDPFQGYVGAVFIKDNLKLNRVAVIFDQAQAYSTGLKDNFVEAYKGLGGEITTTVAYTGGDVDFSAVISQVKGTNPDAVFLPGYYTDVANIVVQARKAGLTVPFVGGDGWDSSKLAEIAGPAIEGSYYVNHYSTGEDRPELKEFLKKYEAKWGAVPDALAAQGYDAMMVLADAMGRAKSLNGADLAKAIAATKNYNGVTGKLSLDANRNASKPAVVVQMKGGVPTFVTSIAPK